MKHYRKTLLFLACNIAFSLAATPSLARTEGPDEFGYIATDDTPYTWEELSPDAGGSCLNVIDQDDWLDGNNDDGAYEIPIGFDFTYYGHAKTNLFISSNGFLAFDTASTEYTDFCIPSVEEPKRILCAFWDDVDPGNLDTNLFPNDGKVYWQTSGSAPNRRLTVEWYKCPHNNDTDARYTFEIVLYESGDFKTMYKDMLDGTGEFADGRSATLGMDDETGTRGIAWHCGTGAAGPVSNGLAILYTVGGADILVLQSRCGNSTGRVWEALNNLGPSYAYVSTMEQNDFVDKLQNEGPWRLVVIDEYSSCLDATTVSALGNYVLSGGRAIISYWGWGDCWFGGLDTAFGASYAGDYVAPMDMYRWDAAHPIFTLPHAVGDMTGPYVDPCNRDGAMFDAANGGIPVAGYTAVPLAAGQAGILVGNSERTILNGQVFDVYDSQQIVDLLENEILYLTGGGGFQSVSNQTTTVFLEWRLNRQTGTYFGDLQLCNRPTSVYALRGPFWYEVITTPDYRLMHPTGINPNDGLPYLDITAQVESQLQDFSLDPGECVVITNIEMYFRTRVPVVGSVQGVWAFVQGLNGGTDTDADGLFDWYEDANGLDKLSALDASRDLDGDGLSNLQEFWAGTSANDKDSCLRILDFRNVDGKMVVEWAGGSKLLQNVMMSRGRVSVSENAVQTKRAPSNRTNRYEFKPTGKSGFFWIEAK